MYYKVLRQSKDAQNAQPELFIVEDAELQHFLHEQKSDNSVLIFDEIDARNLYLLSNSED